MNSVVCERIIDDNCYISKTDLDGKITYVNKNFCKISAYEEDELIGATHSLIKSIDTTTDTYKNMWATILSKKVWKGVLKNSTKFGREFFMDTSIYPVIDNNGDIEEFISFGNDLTHYLDIITYDQLTGLKNRDSLKHDINNIKNYICVIVNLDNFSDVSEFYGSIVGDNVLIETSKRLVNIFKGSTIYRLQADQFAILKILPQKYNKSQLEDIMKINYALLLKTRTL